MKIFRKLVALAVVALAFTGCSESSDPATEQALEGTWMTEYTETEDGIKVIGYIYDTYSLSDHTFETKATFEFGYPINERFGTVTYSGTWKASKKAIHQKIDKDSFEFNFNRSLFDREDCEEFENEMLSELKKEGYSLGYIITSPITDTFEAKDDEGIRYSYTRIN